MAWKVGSRTHISAPSRVEVHKAGTQGARTRSQASTKHPRRFSRRMARCVRTMLRAVADAHCVDYHMASKSVAGGRWMGLTDTFCHHPLVHARGTIVIVIIIVIARMQSSLEIAAWGTMQNLRREACASGCIR
jgi:hypothetical protein